MASSALWFCVGSQKQSGAVVTDEAVGASRTAGSGGSLWIFVSCATERDLSRGARSRADQAALELAGATFAVSTTVDASASRRTGNGRSFACQSTLALHGISAETDAACAETALGRSCVRLVGRTDSRDGHTHRAQIGHVQSHWSSGLCTESAKLMVGVKVENLDSSIGTSRGPAGASPCTHASGTMSRHDVKDRGCVGNFLASPGC